MTQQPAALLHIYFFERLCILSSYIVEVYSHRVRYELQKGLRTYELFLTRINSHIKRAHLESRLGGMVAK